MATKQNGVLATFTPTVTPYTHSTQTSTSLAITTQGWPMYTCPGATMVSGKLLIANNTGGAAAVDVAIVEQTDIIQLDAVANQPGAPDNFTGFSFPTGQYTSSIIIEGAAVSGTFQAGEVLNWTNASETTPAQSAYVQHWDSGNSKLWVRGLSRAQALEPDNTTITYTGATSGATIACGTAHAGSGIVRGHSGKIKYFDSLRGTIYFENHEFRNNLDYSLAKYGDIAQEVRVLSNNNLERSFGNRWRPVATTVERRAASNTTPATEFIDANGVELLVSGVSQVATEQLIVNQKSIADASYLELGGIVLGAYQSLYVKSTAAVSATLIGFEEVAEVAS